MPSPLDLPAIELHRSRELSPLAAGHGIVPLPHQRIVRDRHIWLCILSGIGLDLTPRHDFASRIYHARRDDSSPDTATDIWLAEEMEILHRRHRNVRYADLVAHIPGRLLGEATTTVAYAIPRMYHDGRRIQRPRPEHREDQEHPLFMALLDRLQRLPNVRAADATLAGYRRKDLDDAALAYAAC